GFPMRLSLLALLLAAPAFAQPTAPPPRPVPSRGEKMIAEYFRLQTKQIAEACLTDLTTREDWEKRRPELRRQFFDMIGLWPPSESADLKATPTGTLEGGGFGVEKLRFQSRPGLYVNANLYR